MIKVLVTGANGQLGMTLKEMAADYLSIAFDFKSKQELDITDKEKVKFCIEKGQYNFCINCAAYTNVEQAERTPEPAFRINAEGVRNLTLACSKYRVTLIHISTDYVFDGEKDGPYTVHDIPNPINEYGKSKLAGERHIQEILQEHYIVRTSWLYSKKYGKNFYRAILEKAQKGEDLKVTDTQTGCPTNTKTLAKYLVKELVLGNKPFGLYHFTDGEAMTWYGFAERIVNENDLGEKAQPKRAKNYRTFAKRPKNSVLNLCN